MPTSGNLRAVVRRRDFRRLFATRLTSQLADGVFQASLAGSVFFNPDKQADPMAVALGFAVLILPYSVVGPFAGVFLDRVRRRHVLVLANVVRAATVPAVAALIWAGREDGLFYLTALAVMSVNRFFLSGLSASLPHVVDADRLVTANSLSTTAGTLAFTTGGGVALGLLTVTGQGNHGYALVAAVSVVGYLVSAAAARGFRAGQLGPDDSARVARASARDMARAVTDVVRGMAAGARHVAGRRGAGYLLLVLGAHRLLFGVSLIATLLLYRNYFTDGPVFRAGLTGLGQVFVAGALGTLVAAAVTPWVVRHVAPRNWVTGLLLAAAVAEVALGFPYLPPTMVAASFAVGVVSQGLKIVTDTAVQLECDDDFQGRVFSLYDTLFNGAMVIGLLIGALTLPETGRSYVVLGAVAVGYAVVGATYAWAASRWYRRQPVPAAGNPVTATTLRAG